MNNFLEQAEKASDFYMRIMIAVVAVVSLAKWAVEPGNNQAVFAFFAMLFAIAMTISGIANFVRSREK